MPYTIFEKKATRIGSPALSISKSARVSLNVPATKILDHNAVEFVLLLWDPDKFQMALRPITKKDARAYKLSYGRNKKGCSFVPRAFMNHIGWNSTDIFIGPAEWNEDQGIMEIKLPESRFKKDDRQQNLLPIGGAKRSTRAG